MKTKHKMVKPRRIAGSHAQAWESVLTAAEEEALVRLVEARLIAGAKRVAEMAAAGAMAALLEERRRAWRSAYVVTKRNPKKK